MLAGGTSRAKIVLAQAVVKKMSSFLELKQTFKKLGL